MFSQVALLVWIQPLETSFSTEFTVRPKKSRLCRFAGVVPNYPVAKKQSFYICVFVSSKAVKTCENI